jgi:hypothetical protein
MRRSGPVLLTIIAVLVVIVMAYSSTAGVRLSSKYTPLVNAMMLVKYELTTSHLWFEEMLGGDREERMDYIYFFLAQAESHARVMIEGGRDAKWQYVPVDDDEMVQDLSDIIVLIRDLRYITTKRYENYKTAAPGTDFEMYYDSMFLDLIIKADQIEVDLRERIKRDLYLFRLIQISLAMLVVAVSLFTTVLLIRNNREAEERASAMDKDPAGAVQDPGRPDQGSA